MHIRLYCWICALLPLVKPLFKRTGVLERQ
uniref:Uncharacterized protein n=1 Tax=Anguilla anguilla TaxID=7936 RepID=A0A0E9TFD7_ANGAN